MFESIKMKKRSVILDTDIGPDCDDVGALAVMFSYAKELGVEVLGVNNCTSNPYGAPAIDGIREYCKMPEFKIGAYPKAGFYADAMTYNKYVAENFSTKYKNGSFEAELSAVEVMGRDVSIVCKNPACASELVRAIVPSDKKPALRDGKACFTLKPAKVFLFDSVSGERLALPLKKLGGKNEK